MVKDFPYAGFTGDIPIRDDQTTFRMRLVAARLIEWRLCGWLSRILYWVADRLDETRG